MSDKLERALKLGNFMQTQFHRIAYERGAGKLTATKLGKELGVPQTSFSAWLNGIRLPDYKNTMKLASAFGDEIYDICGYPRPSPQDARLHAIMDKWADLSPEVQDQILSIAEKYANYGTDK